MNILFVLALIFCLIFYGGALQSRSSGSKSCPIHPEPFELPVPLPASLQTALHQVEKLLPLLFQNQTENSGAPGLFAIATYMNQTIWSFGYGSKNHSGSEPPDGDTLFQIGSVTKIFTNMMLYQLYQKGVVRSIDDPIEEYVPEFSINNPFPGSSGITWRQLASHLAGLQRISPCNNFVSGGCNDTTDTMLKRISQLYLIRPPEEYPSYSNLGFALIGRLLERVIGISYEDWVEKQILEPLEMSRTGYNLTKASLDNNIAQGFIYNQMGELWDFGWEAPAGSLFSTGNDLAKFMKLLVASQGALKSTPVLNADLIQEMLSPQFIEADGVTMWASPFEDVLQNGYWISRKSGGSPGGYTSAFSVIPELQLGLTMLWNGFPVDEFGILTAVHNILIPALQQYLTANKAPLPQPPNPADYEGTYVNAGWGQFVINQTDNELTLKGTPISAPIKYVNPELLQIVFPQGTFPCIFYSGSGEDREYLYFNLDENGTPQNFTLPSITGWEVYWTKA